MTIGLVIVFIAVTGASIVFRSQLEPIVNRDLLTVPACSERVPLDTLTANAAATRPNAQLDYIRILAADDPTAARIPATMVRFTDQIFVYLNPCTGASLGQRHRYGGVLGTIEQLHRFRFMEGGSIITATCVIVFSIVLVLGGVFLWWPATLQGLKGSLKFNSKLPSPARTLNLHKTFGFYAGLVILVSALTGLPQAADWYRSGLYTITGSAQPPKLPKSAEPVPGARRLPMETMWQRAQAIVPQPKDVLIHYPKKTRDPVDMYLIAQDAPHENARTYLNLDAYTGATLSYTPYSENSLGHKLYFLTLSWHSGHLGGVAGQLILLFGALSVPALAYTGIASYLRRRARSRAAAIPGSVGSYT
ncbi:hypothetical protein BH11PSE11_BH11PSE11_01790 [soil metagenome]